jgi:hypothetical protein
MIHALVATQAYGETRRRTPARRCPQCGHEQLTAEGRLSEPVACERCAVPIPPKHAPGQSGERGNERFVE